MKSPQLMSLEELYNRYVAKSTDEPNKIYFSRGLGAAMNLGNAFKGAVSTGTPFLIPDYRFGVVKRGLLRTSINLMMHDIGAESILFITPGTIVEPKYVSDDFMLDGISIPSDVFQLAHQGHVPSLFATDSETILKLCKCYSFVVKSEYICSRQRGAIMRDG